MPKTRSKASAPLMIPALPLAPVATLLERAATATCSLADVPLPYLFFFAEGAHVRVPVRDCSAVAYTAVGGTVFQFRERSMDARALAAVQKHATTLSSDLNRDPTLEDLYGSPSEPRKRQPFAALRNCSLTSADVAAYVAVAVLLFPSLELESPFTVDAACDPSGRVLCISDTETVFAVNVADHRGRLFDLPRFAETDLLRIVMRRATDERNLLTCIQDVLQIVQTGVSVDMVHATDEGKTPHDAQMDGDEDITLGAQGSTLVTDLVDLIVQHAPLPARRRRR